MTTPITPTEPPVIQEIAGGVPTFDTPEEEYAIKSEGTMKQLPRVIDEINDSVNWTKQTAEQVFGNAEIAAAAAALAQGASNYMGKWSELPAAPLPAGSGVSHNVFGQLTGWVSAVDIADPTASEPALGNDDWFPAGFVPMLYRGPWEAQSGDAAPPYWVSYGGGGNLLLHSKGLTNAAYSAVGVTVTGGELGADGSDAFSLIEGSTGGGHTINQGVTVGLGLHILEVDVKPAGRDYVLLRASGAAVTEDTRACFNVSTGTLSSTSGDVVIAGVSKDYGNGFYRVYMVINVTSADDVLAMIAVVDDGGTSFGYTGDGVSGLIVGRPNLTIGKVPVRPVDTTTAPIPYTPPIIYALQKYQSDVKATTPGTDETVWKEVGSGGGSGAGTATDAERVFTSADQDGSSNIAVALDASQNTEWQLDFNGSPLPNTSGAYSIALTELADTIDNVQFFHIRMKRAGRKTVNLTATNESSASLTVSWLEAPTFLATAGAWDMVTLHRWPANPNVLFASLNDGRV